MEATRSISTFLRHVRERDLPDPELFELKAQTFDLMADQYDEDGQPDDAAECRRIAAESRVTASLTPRWTNSASLSNGGARMEW